MDFLFFYELKVRDIEPALLICSELEHRGYSCAISHFAAWGFARNMLRRPKVIVTPWLRDDENVFAYTRNIFKTKRLVNLQAEQIYAPQDTKMAACSSLALKAYHLCWGEIIANRYIQAGVPKARAPITGSIKMDFLTPLFSSLYDSKADLAKKYNIDPGKIWILFISSLAFASHNEKAINTLYQKYGDYSSFVDLEKRTRTKLLDWFIELVNCRSDIEFIYRPHPSEEIDSELKNFGDIKRNCHVIAEESLAQWIVCCDEIDVWLTTSIAEVYYSGRSCNILRPFEVPLESELDYYIGGRFCKTQEEFIAAHTHTECTDFPIDPQKITHLYSSTNKPSFIRTADALELILHDPNAKADFYTGLNKKYFNTFKRYFVSLLGDIILLTGIKFSHIFDSDSRLYQSFTFLENRTNGLRRYLQECKSKFKYIVEIYHKQEEYKL